MQQGDKAWTEVVRRMDILIALMLERVDVMSKVSMTDKIVKLGELGVSPSETARILGRTVNYVTGSLSARKRRGKGEGH